MIPLFCIITGHFFCGYVSQRLLPQQKFWQELAAWGLRLLVASLSTVVMLSLLQWQSSWILREFADNSDTGNSLWSGALILTLFAAVESGRIFVTTCQLKILQDGIPIVLTISGIAAAIVDAYHTAAPICWCVLMLWWTALLSGLLQLNRLSRGKGLLAKWLQLPA